MNIEKLKKYFKCFEYGIFTEGKGVGIVQAKGKTGYFLKKMNQQGKHIFIRPRLEQEPYYLLIDDIDEQQLNEDHKIDGCWNPGRMVVETSPENYQVWVHNNRAMDDTEKGYWLDKFQSDPGATSARRWGRCPGYRNVKVKYKRSNGCYPEAKLIWWDDQSLERLPSIDVKVLVKDIFRRGMDSHHRVSMKQSLDGDINRAMYDRGYDYRTDYAYILALLTRGYGDEAIKQRIHTERTEWGNYKGSKEVYLQRSIRKAHEFLSRNENNLKVRK